MWKKHMEILAFKYLVVLIVYLPPNIFVFNLKYEQRTESIQFEQNYHFHSISIKCLGNVVKCRNEKLIGMNIFYSIST
jgi:hypothetical protein